MKDFAILPSKPGQYRTEPVAGVEPLEAYDYVFCGRVRARFVLARLAAETKVKVVDESGAASVNWVPTKFLERHVSLEDARAAIQKLACFGSSDIRLVRTA